jgi:hypothetical protein
MLGCCSRCRRLRTPRDRNPHDAPRCVMAIHLRQSAIVLTATFACGCALVPDSSSSDVTFSLGDPCTPAAEFDPNFAGFSLREVSVEEHSLQCRIGLCLVNHFRGRTSCPLGQDKQGRNAEGGCRVPGTQTPVEGPRTNDPAPADPRRLRCVQPQCSRRKAIDAVYCSCRCANANGRRDDGYNYCSCRAGFDCTPLIDSIGSAPDHLSGSYCVKSGSQYDPQRDACGPSVPGAVTDCPD